MKITFRPARSLILLLLACLLPLLLAFYVGSGPAETVWLKAPGWSRARLVGTTRLEDAVPVALDDAGRIYLFLVQPDGTASRPQVIRLDRNVQLAWARTLDAALVQPKHPQILWDGRSIRLFWISDQHLYTASLDTAGTTHGAPALLSGETTVDSYATASDGRGRVFVWYAGARASPGIYALPPGDLGGRALLVDAAGVAPELRADSAGTLHATWSVAEPPDDVAVYYAAYPGGAYRAGEQYRVVTLKAARAGSNLDGPWFGLDQQHGYLLWTMLATSGRGAGSRLSQYISFPLAQPAQASEIRPITVPDGANLTYEALRENDLLAGPRVMLASDLASSGAAPSGISINPTFEPELALAAEAQMHYKYHQTVGQVGALFFRGGAPTSYQLLSFDQRTAFTPALISDRSRYLYVTWRETHSPGYDVYFASTAPDVTLALSYLTGADIARLAFEICFGLLSGAIFAPFAILLWSVAPLLILALTWFARRDGAGITHWGTIIGLTLALGAYWAGKLISFGAALAYVPFSAWIPGIPSWLALPIQIAVPSLIAAGALRAAWHYTYRVDRRSAILFMLIYAGIDSLCTMAIYGGLLFDAF
jgi:hypothetical protein